MKRALAERAKQSGLPNGVATPSVPPPLAPLSAPTASQDAPSSSVPSLSHLPPAPSLQHQQATQTQSLMIQEQNLSKINIPKQQEPSPATGSTSTPVTGSKTVQSPRPSPSPRPKKRLREAANKLKQLEEEDEEDPNASAFYLKHQNRALASELRSVKYQLARLERERDYRRSQCSQAVHSINALEAIWGQLESSLGSGSSASASIKPPPAESFAPLSTGSGTSVEMIGAYMNSLARLGTSARSRIKGNTASDDYDYEKKRVKEDEDKMEVVGEEPQVNGNEVDGAESTEENRAAKELSRVTENIAERAAVLQSWIWSLLQKAEKANPLNNGEIMPPPSLMELQDTVTRLEADNTTLQERLEELSRTRDELVESDRRVRRGLYRLAAGRVQLKEVLKAVASADEDREAAAAWIEAAGSSVIAPPLTSSTSASSIAKNGSEKIKAEDDNGTAAASSEEVAQLKKQLADFNDVAKARDEQIQKLLAEREEHLKRINTLMLKEDTTSSHVPSNQEIQRSDLYLELTAKLATNERKMEELEEKTKRIKEEWSKAIANAEASKKAMEDLQSKHMKRWAELAEEHPDIGPADAGDKPSGVTKAEEIMTLKHKLTQALENVRQAESIRKTLDEAIIMNESLQAKVDEFKSKYNSLQAEKAARATNNSGSGNNANGGNMPSTSSGSSSSKAKSTSSSSQPSDKSAEKLHREYKRARKELAAATASKEAAKAKLEKSEKEKEHMNQMNSRLLKQAAEKDEINAKSLSTILHLKQLTEQISKERDNLEQQVKSAEQLALAARLAANARERVAEEFEKERKALEAQVKDWEQKCADLVQEKAMAESKLSQEKARMSKLIGDAQKAKDRCEELVMESTKLQEEKQKMIESLAVAQREATEAAALSQRLAESQGGGMVAGFTAEQLNTQVTVLKNRLACPVCNVRDKKCILLRCRHMFCKQCVDENIKNRSRKCPACGGRFDTKDVADVWL